MSNTVTVRKNWKKKIKAICDGVSVIKKYSLDNNFSGEEIVVGSGSNIPFEEFVISCMESRSNLVYDKETGICTLRFHSNLWYEWSNKIQW